MYFVSVEEACVVDVGNRVIILQGTEWGKALTATYDYHECNWRLRTSKMNHNFSMQAIWNVSMLVKEGIEGRNYHQNLKIKTSKTI